MYCRVLGMRKTGLFHGNALRRNHRQGAGIWEEPRWARALFAIGQRRHPLRAGL